MFGSDRFSSFYIVSLDSNTFTIIDNLIQSLKFFSPYNSKITTNNMNENNDSLKIKNSKIKNLKVEDYVEINGEPYFFNNYILK